MLPFLSIKVYDACHLPESGNSTIILLILFLLTEKSSFSLPALRKSIIIFSKLMICEFLSFAEMSI